MKEVRIPPGISH